MFAEIGNYWFFFIGLVVALWRLDSIDRRLKEIVAELRKASLPPAPPLTEEEAALERRRAAIREVQENWPTYK
jgi:hypothetical protein